MAIFETPFDDEEKKKDEEKDIGALTQPTPMSTTPAPAPVSGGPKAPTSSGQFGQFVGLQKFIQANQPKIAQMGSTIAKTVGEKADTATQDVKNVQDNTSNEINNKRINSADYTSKDVTDLSEGDTFDKLGKLLTEETDTQSTIDNYFTNVEKPREIAENLETTIEGYSPGGMGVNRPLLREGFGDVVPNYSQKSQSIDALLLGVAPESREALGGLQAKYTDFTKPLFEGETALLDLANEVAKTNPVEAQKIIDYILNKSEELRPQLEQSSKDYESGEMQTEYDTDYSNLFSGARSDIEKWYNEVYLPEQRKKQEEIDRQRQDKANQEGWNQQVPAGVIGDQTYGFSDIPILSMNQILNLLDDPTISDQIKNSIISTGVSGQYGIGYGMTPEQKAQLDALNKLSSISGLGGAYIQTSATPLYTSEYYTSDSQSLYQGIRDWISGKVPELTQQIALKLPGITNIPEPQPAPIVIPEDLVPTIQPTSGIVPAGGAAPVTTGQVQGDLTKLDPTKEFKEINDLLMQHPPGFGSPTIRF